MDGGYHEDPIAVGIQTDKERLVLYKTSENKLYLQNYYNKISINKEEILDKLIVTTGNTKTLLDVYEQMLFNNRLVNFPIFIDFKEPNKIRTVDDKIKMLYDKNKEFIPLKEREEPVKKQFMW